MKMLMVFLMSLLCVVNASAESITLKDGQVIEGRIVEQDDFFIEIEIDGQIATHYVDDVESIQNENAEVLVSEEQELEDAPEEESIDSPIDDIKAVIGLDGEALTLLEIYQNDPSVKQEALEIFPENVVISNDLGVLILKSSKQLDAKKTGLSVFSPPPAFSGIAVEPSQEMEETQFIRIFFTKSEQGWRIIQKDTGHYDFENITDLIEEAKKIMTNL